MSGGRGMRPLVLDFLYPLLLNRYVRVNVVIFFNFSRQIFLLLKFLRRARTRLFWGGHGREYSGWARTTLSLFILHPCLQPLFLVCLSVCQDDYLEIPWKYQAKINIKYVDLQSVKAQKNNISKSIQSKNTIRRIYARILLHSARNSLCN